MNILLFNFHDVVLLMTAYQCSLFALLLLFINRESQLTNFLLAGFLLSHAAIPMDILINFGAAFRDWAIGVSPNLFYVFGLAYWLEGPLLLWYTRSLIYKNYQFKYTDLLYLVPFLVYAIYKLLNYYLLDFSTKVSVLQEYTLQEESSLELAIGFAREALRLGFGIMCVLEIRKARRLLKHNFSSLEKIDFSWLNILVTGFLILWSWAVLVSLSIILDVKFGFNIDYRIMGLAENYSVLLLISALIFFSLSYSTLFEGVAENEPREDPHKTGINPLLIEKLNLAMETEKPYLVNSLTLEQLAQQVDIPGRTLSTIINRHFQKNFFEFVNYYRIEEAKRLLSDSNHMRKNVLDIMLEVGFNSKATFNTFFKKLVGLTPSQYRKQHCKCAKSV